jgi:hypothetical protein
VNLQLQPRREPMTAEDRAERFARLKEEFLGGPDIERKERMLEAFMRWRTAGQDRRGICIEPGLTLLEQTADKLIEARKKRERG